MQTLIIVVGCLLSFVLGAYIRQPFALWRQKAPAEVDEVTAADQIAKEWANMMAYSGGKQYGED